MAELSKEMTEFVKDTAQDSYQSGFCDGLALTINLGNQIESFNTMELARQVLVSVWDDLTERQRSSVEEKTGGLVSKIDGSFTRSKAHPTQGDE